MLIQTWNVQELNSCPRQLAVKRLIVENKVDVILLQETIASLKAMEIIAKRCWGQGDWVTQASQSFSGGLVTLYNKNSFQAVESVSAKGNLMIKLRETETSIVWMIINH